MSRPPRSRSGRRRRPASPTDAVAASPTDAVDTSTDAVATSPPLAEAIVIDETEVSIVDAHRLRRRVAGARDDTARARLAGSVDAARARLARRRSAVPELRYPDELPISGARSEIAEAIAAHQVVVVAGETGSGKTTQIPKICLGLGRGVRGTIGHTQPRRIAARAVATRIAEETETTLGDAVGFAVRFDDRSSADTLVKVMTDGILLREIGRDPLLLAYDTLIIDEAHERSLNIDFILGFLKQLLPRRPDLKVVITSATIDPGRFADHFATPGNPVPVISVSGRTYPVEVRYRPRSGPAGDSDDTGADDSGRDDHDDIDAIAAIEGAVAELMRAGPGDILVFLATEREIRDTTDALRRSQDDRVDILPLFSRLSTGDQQKVFTVSDRRRIVLATNVAETSLTVPGIRYVVDAGTARISRYSLRTKVQRLPIEPVSQASARQRAGRCGRVADGICIRLYSEDDFDTRPEFTEPEILRTNLASVILTMTALNLGDIAEFPFVEAPDARSIRDGLGLLEELGAVDGTGTRRGLTPVGRDIADLPIDPRWARMVVAARENGALAEVLVIVAALSLPDVRERPTEKRGAADESHARFAAAGSDFLSVLALWRYLEEKREELSNNQFRKMCEREFLHWLRIREWRELVRQLERITADKGWVPNTSDAAPTAVHQSLLAGLLGHVGVRDGDTREFLGARGTRFVVFPGSPLAKKPPRFVMAGEVVETSRLFARTVAGIEPEWAEKIAGSLAKRSYSEPHWSIKRGSAMAYERVTLYGVTLVAHRAVPFGKIDPETSRDLFIRHALVEGEWRTNHPFFDRNRALLDDARDLEHRARRGDLVIDDDQLFDFYDQRIGSEVVSAAHFDTWWKRARRADPELLDLTPDTVADPDAISAIEFPDTWQQGEAHLDLSYRFSPGAARDGVTVGIPVALLPRIRPSGFDWLVPGLRTDLAVAMVRTLPKSVRRRLGPAADIGESALAALTPRSEPIAVGLARELTRQTGVPMSANDFDPSALPAHLRMTYEAIADDGSVIAAAESLTALRDLVGGAGRAADKPAGSSTAPQAAAPAAPSRPPITTWTAATIGTVDRTITETVAGQQVTSHPCLIAVDGGVLRGLATTGASATAETHRAIRRLLELSIPALKPSATGELAVPARLALSQSPYPTSEALLRDCTTAAIGDLVGSTDDVRDPDAYAALRARVARDTSTTARRILAVAADALTRVAPIRAEIDRLGDSPATVDVTEQLGDLVFEGFISSTDAANRARIGVHLDAVLVRLERLPAGAAMDARAMESVERVMTRWAQVAQRATPARRDSINEQVHWMVQELRIGLFAERIRPAYPVSEKRTLRAIDALAT